MFDINKVEDWEDDTIVNSDNYIVTESDESIYPELDIWRHVSPKDKDEYIGWNKPFNHRFLNRQYQIWRGSVKLNSGHRCVKCGDETADHCHHILNYATFPHLRYKTHNGVLMCKKCHYKFHKLFGRKNNNKFQLQYYLRGY